jgi:hypothetical protein
MNSDGQQRQVSKNGGRTSPHHSQDACEIQRAGYWWIGFSQPYALEPGKVTTRHPRESAKGDGRVNVRAMTAAERMSIGAALGRDVLQAADALRAQLNEHGKASAAMWRAFLQALMDGAGETAMSTPVGMAIQMAILSKIQEKQMATTRVSAVQGNPVAASQDGNSDEYLRSLLHNTLRLVTAPGVGPFTRQAAIVLQHDLGRNIANAYRWYHLLLAVRRDGAVDPATERAIQACVRTINDGAPGVSRDNRRSREVQRAWRGRTPALAV